MLGVLVEAGVEATATVGRRNNIFSRQSFLPLLLENWSSPFITRLVVRICINMQSWWVSWRCSWWAWDRCESRGPDFAAGTVLLSTSNILASLLQVSDYSFAGWAIRVETASPSSSLFLL